MDGHDYFEELIIREDSLSEIERSELETHLANCMACEAFRKDWSAVNALLTNAPVAEPVRDFEIIFETGLAEPNPGRRPIPWKGLAVTSLLALLIIAANFVMITNHVWMTLIVRAMEKLMMARLIWDSFTAFLYVIRTPLLIGGTAAIIAAFIVGFGILLGLKQYHQTHEKRGV